MDYNAPRPRFTLEVLLSILATPDARFALSILCCSLFAVLALTKLFGQGSFVWLRPTLPTFIIALYFLLVSFPATVWFAESRDPIRYTYLAAIHITPPLICLGALAANVLVPKPDLPVRAFLFSPLEKSPMDRRLTFLFVTMLIASVVVVSVYIATAEYVPLLASVSSYGDFEGDELRHSIYRLPEPLIYSYALTARFLLPFSLLYAYLMRVAYGGWWGRIFVATVIWTLFVSLLPFERSTPLSVFVFLAMIFRFRGASLRARTVIGILLVIAVAALVGGVLSRTQYQEDIEVGSVGDYAFEFVVGRIWLDPSYMSIIAFTRYNDSLGFLGGQSMRVLSLVGVEYHSFSSVGFTADLWANFGWLGVVAGTSVLGFVLQLIQTRLLIRKDAATLIIYVMLLLNGAWLLYSGILATMVVSVYGLAIVFLLIMRNREGVERAARATRSGQNGAEAGVALAIGRPHSITPGRG